MPLIKIKVDGLTNLAISRVDRKSFQFFRAFQHSHPEMTHYDVSNVDAITQNPLKIYFGLTFDTRYRQILLFEKRIVTGIRLHGHEYSAIHLEEWLKNVIDAYLESLV